jgi:hypothetical protein
LRQIVYCGWIGALNWEISMVGPRPAGRPWTPAEEVQLRKLVASKIKVDLIARKLKRSPGAVYARINSLKKLPSDLAISARSRSLPSERLAAYAQAEIDELKEKVRAPNRSTLPK